MLIGKLWKMKSENIPEIITLCGSTKFKKQFIEINKMLSLEGKIVLSVGLFNHADSENITKDQKKMLDELHLRKIDLSDSIYVIDVDGYIGESTQREINYARDKSKDIIYYSNQVKNDKP